MNAARVAISALLLTAIAGVAIGWGVWSSSRKAVPLPPRRFEVVVATTFPDQLQTWAGSASGTPDGELVAWCGHRSADGTRSALVYVHPPDLITQLTECAGPAPDGFEYASAAYDPSAATFYVFGGWGNARPTNALSRIKLSPSTWTWERVLANGVPPSPRNGAPMVLDTPRHRLILCGGDAGTQGNFVPVGDCWQFNLVTSTWSRLPEEGQPAARWHAAMAVDPVRQKAYLFGGAGQGRPDDTTLYALDLPTTRWRALTTTGSSPPSLQGATFTYDAANGVLLLAGGLRHTRPGPATISQAWVFDPATAQWDETDCGDALRRRDAVGAYCPTTREHLLVGGRVSTAVGNFYDRGSPVTRDVTLRVRPLAPPTTKPHDPATNVTAGAPTH